VSRKPYQIETKLVQSSGRNLYPPYSSVLFPVTLNDPFQGYCDFHMTEPERRAVSRRQLRLLYLISMEHMPQPTLFLQLSAASSLPHDPITKRSICIGSSLRPSVCPSYLYILLCTESCDSDVVGFSKGRGTPLERWSGAHLPFLARPMFL